ncbi:MAG: hypothetical protein ACKVS8_06100 [Phycisphaerales bacterium]
MKIIVKRQLTVMSVAFMCLGLLLWARFMLVTGHPRTATAQPIIPAPRITDTVVPRGPAVPAAQPQPQGVEPAAAPASGPVPPATSGRAG